MYACARAFMCVRDGVQSLPQVEEIAQRRQAVFQYVKSAQAGAIYYLNSVKLSAEDVSAVVGADKNERCCLRGLAR